MTMWLTYPVMVKVKPAEGKAGWSEMHGLPTGDGPVMMFTCNRPEGVLFERLFDHLEGPQ